MSISRREFLKRFSGALISNTKASLGPVGKLAEFALAPGEAAAEILAPAAMSASTRAKNLEDSYENGWRSYVAILLNSLNISAVTPQESCEIVDKRIEAVMPPIINAFRGFKDLKDLILTGDAEKDRAITGVIASAVEKKKALYRSELQRLFNEYAAYSAARTPEYDPHKPIDYDSIFGEISGADVDRQYRKKEAKNLHRFSQRSNLYTLEGYVDSYLELGGKNGFPADRFNEAMQKKLAALGAELEPLARGVGLTPDMLSAVMDTDPTFLGNLSHEIMLGNEPDYSKIELYHFFDDKTLFERMKTVSEGLLNGMARDFYQVSGPSSALEEIFGTKHDIRFPVDNLEQVLQQKYQDIVRKIFPEIPVAEIPLPKFDPDAPSVMRPGKRNERLVKSQSQAKTEHDPWVDFVNRRFMGELGERPAKRSSHRSRG